MKMKTVFCIFGSVLIISACDGGEKGRSTTSLPIANVGNEGGGSGSGGNGTASFYGFNSANGIVSNALLRNFIDGSHLISRIGSQAISSARSHFGA